MASLSRAKLIYWFIAAQIFLIAFVAVTDAIRTCAAYGISYGKALVIVLLSGVSGILLSSWTFVSKKVRNRLDRVYPRTQQMTKPLQLIATNRGGDVHVQIDGHSEMWGSGKSTYEAVGNLITHHPEVCDIILVYPQKRVDREE